MNTKDIQHNKQPYSIGQTTLPTGRVVNGRCELVSIYSYQMVIHVVVVDCDIDSLDHESVIGITYRNQPVFTNNHYMYNPKGWVDEFDRLIKHTFVGLIPGLVQPIARCNNPLVTKCLNGEITGDYRDIETRVSGGVHWVGTKSGRFVSKEPTFEHLQRGTQFHQEMMGQWVPPTEQEREEHERHLERVRNK